MVQYLTWGPIHCQLLIPHHFGEHLYPIGLLQMSMIHRWRWALFTPRSGIGRMHEHKYASQLVARVSRIGMWIYPEILGTSVLTKKESYTNPISRWIEDIVYKWINLAFVCRGKFMRMPIDSEKTGNSSQIRNLLWAQPVYSLSIYIWR